MPRTRDGSPALILGHASAAADDYAIINAIIHRAAGSMVMNNAEVSFQKIWPGWKQLAHVKLACCDVGKETGVGGGTGHGARSIIISKITAPFHGRE